MRSPWFVIFLGLAIGLALGALASCGQDEQAAAPAPPVALDLPALKEAVYPLWGVDGRETVTLRDGHFVDEAARLRADLADSLVCWGDVDGDGRDEAVTVLHYDTGGSGLFREVVVFGERGGHALPLGAGYLGDRVKVHSVAVQDARIVVGMVTHAQDDPMCCPTEAVVRAYRLEGGEVVPDRP